MHTTRPNGALSVNFLSPLSCGVSHAWSNAPSKGNVTPVLQACLKIYSRGQHLHLHLHVQHLLAGTLHSSTGCLHKHVKSQRHL